MDYCLVALSERPKPGSNHDSCCTRSLRVPRLAPGLISMPPKALDPCSALSVAKAFHL